MEMSHETTAMGLSLAFWYLHWQGELTPSVLHPHPGITMPATSPSSEISDISTPQHSIPKPYGGCTRHSGPGYAST